MKRNAHVHAPARHATIDGIAHLRLDHIQLARERDRDLGLLAVHGGQFHRDLEAVLRALAATVTRHGFHRAHDAKVFCGKRINFRQSKLDEIKVNG